MAEAKEKSSPADQFSKYFRIFKFRGGKCDNGREVVFGHYMEGRVLSNMVEKRFGCIWEWGSTSG